MKENVIHAVFGVGFIVAASNTIYWGIELLARQPVSTAGQLSYYLGFAGVVLAFISLPSWPQEGDDSSYVVNSSRIHDKFGTALLLGERPSPELLVEAEMALKRLEAHEGGDIGRWAQTLARDLAPFRG